MAMFSTSSDRSISRKEPGGRPMDTSDTPAYYLGYHVQETAAGNIWTHVATAWPSPNDQGGFTVTLQAVPPKPCHDLLYISGAFRRLYPVGTDGHLSWWMRPQNLGAGRL